MKNITETITATQDFSTLLTAIKAAKFSDTLSGNGPFTLFAPSNEAFAKIPADTLQAILQDTIKLTSILTYHVVAGILMAKDVITMKEATTLEGSKITVKVKNDIVINNAKVIKTDMECSNGIIHMIDRVLMP